jgi:hypothetical protein
MRVAMCVNPHRQQEDSFGHDVADQLEAGDRLEGANVVERRDVPYDEPFTYDIFPASDSHAYVAAGVLVGTTLRR